MAEQNLEDFKKIGNLDKIPPIKKNWEKPESFLMKFVNFSRIFFVVLIFPLSLLPLQSGEWVFKKGPNGEAAIFKTYTRVQIEEKGLADFLGKQFSQTIQLKNGMAIFPRLTLIEGDPGFFDLFFFTSIREMEKIYPHLLGFDFPDLMKKIPEVSPIEVIKTASSIEEGIGPLAKENIEKNPPEKPSEILIQDPVLKTKLKPKQSDFSKVKSGQSWYRRPAFYTGLLATSIAQFAFDEGVDRHNNESNPQKKQTAHDFLVQGSHVRNILAGVTLINAFIEF